MLPYTLCLEKMTLLLIAISSTYINQFEYNFGRNVAKKVRSQMYFISHLT